MSADSTEPSSPQPQRIDGRYEVLRKLGQGGFGAVYLVRDSLLRGKQVALKIVSAPARDRASFDERFLSEIEILRGLRHEGIPQIFDTGRTAEGGLYFTMEFVDGVTLSAVLRDLERRNERLAPDRMVRLLRRVLQVLEYAHSRGVVHRDLKPGNIMLVRPGTDSEDVRLLDFGIAKVVRGATDHFDLPSLNTGGGIGTPHYMAPEQLRGKAFDGRTDLYALGVILYQMCAGRFPFKGDSDIEMAAARLVEDPEPLPDDLPTPAWMRTLVFSLLERAQEKRPSTREVLELILRRDSRRTDLAQPAAEDPASIPTRPLSAPAPPARSRAVRALGAVAAVLVLILAAWALFFRGERPQTSSAQTQVGDDSATVAQPLVSPVSPQQVPSSNDGEADAAAVQTAAPRGAPLASEARPTAPAELPGARDSQPVASGDTPVESATKAAAVDERRPASPESQRYYEPDLTRELRSRWNLRFVEVLSGVWVQECEVSVQLARELGFEVEVGPNVKLPLGNVNLALAEQLAERLNQLLPADAKQRFVVPDQARMELVFAAAAADGLTPLPRVESGVDATKPGYSPELEAGQAPPLGPVDAARVNQPTRVRGLVGNVRELARTSSPKLVVYFGGAEHDRLARSIDLDTRESFTDSLADPGNGLRLFLEMESP